MMIASVVRAQYINVTDKKTPPHNVTDRHVAIANAAPTDCVGRQKIVCNTYSYAASPGVVLF